MDRRDFARLGIGLAAGGATATVANMAVSNMAVANTAVAADGGDKAKHRVAIQVSSEERKIQELALGNAHNYAAHYKAKNEPYQIEVVAFGPGYNMVRSDISMVAGTVEELKKTLGDSITFSACQNTRAAIAASMGQKPEQVPQMNEATSTPSGIVRLAELQEQGWAYIRP